MPNMSAHMAVAKRVSELLNIDSEDFYKGNLLPDLYKDKIKSHYKIQGKIYLIPDIEYVKKKLNFKDKMNLGVFTHLLLDKYYLEEYLPNRYKENVFEKSKVLYKDYDILNKDIVKHFNLDIKYLKSILKNYKEGIDLDKLEYNLKCLDIVEYGDTIYLNKKEYLSFLEEISKKIAKEISKYVY